MEVSCADRLTRPTFRVTAALNLVELKVLVSSECLVRNGLARLKIVCGITW